MPPILGILGIELFKLGILNWLDSLAVVLSSESLRSLTMSLYNEIVYSYS